MATGGCTGYRWSQGQYVLSDCNQESSTFFIILGFTMLVLVLLLFIVVVVACVRRLRNQNQARGPQTIAMAPIRGEDDCVINVDGTEQPGGPTDGRNLDLVKCVIMAGEEKPTFIAHPLRTNPTAPASARPAEEKHEAHPAESSKQAQPSGVT